MLVYMCSNSVMVEHGSFLAADGGVSLRLYVLQQLAVLAGFIIPSLFKRADRFFADRRIKAVILSVFILSMSAPLYVKSVPVIAVFITACALCIGATGALVYYQLAAGADFDSMKGRRDIGYVTGLGGALSLLIQMTVQSIPETWYFAELLLLTAVFAYVLYSTDIAGAAGRGDHSPAPEPQSKWTGRGICLGAAVCFMLMLLASYESHMNRISFAGYFYGWTRMITAVGYLAIGVLFGRARRGAVSVAMVCIALVSVISNLLMLKSGEGWWLHLALFYLVLGTLVAYYNLMFMELSAHTGSPGLWAPMGRILDAGVTSVFTSIGGLLPATDIYSLIMCLALFAGVIIFMAMGGFLSMGAYSAGTEGSVSDTPTATSVEDRVGLLAGRYSLTPREREVFTLLVTTEDKNQDIADRLYISRRQLQNHIASIYEKTGANNRAGLLLMMDPVQEQGKQS